MSVKPIPEGYHSLTPFLTVRDAVRAIEFYKQAFGAQERGVMKGPDGKVMHAELKIGDSIIMISSVGPREAMVAVGMAGAAVSGKSRASRRQEVSEAEWPDTTRSMFSA